MHLVDEESLKEFISSIDKSIWSEDDQIIFFNWYDDETFSCEKEKNAYDYRLQKKVPVMYNANLTPEQGFNLYNKFLHLYEEVRIKFLRNSKEEVKKQIVQQFDFVVANLRGLRSTLLSKSDWTQIPDVPLDEDVKIMWSKYRQTLRDVTKNPNWSNENILNIEFPIDPENYLLRYPNKDVEYLSTPDQFENHALMLTKAKLLRFASYISLPMDEDLNLLSYSELKRKVNKAIQKIDQDLELTINYKTGYMGACADSATNLQSGLTDEAREVLSELLQNNPEVYYHDAATQAINTISK
jgi:hypothetical protein